MCFIRYIDKLRDYPLRYYAISMLLFILYGYQGICIWFTVICTSSHCVSILIGPFGGLLQYWTPMVKYTIAQQVFQYDTYVKNKSCRSCKRFHNKYPGVWVPASSTISELVNKLYSTGSLADKKFTRQNVMLIKKKSDEKGTRSEHSPHMISSAGTGINNDDMQSD
jgi:hypothetical protein